MPKNFETVSTLMQKKLWPLFSGHGVYTECYKFIANLLLSVTVSVQAKD